MRKSSTVVINCRVPAIPDVDLSRNMLSPDKQRSSLSGPSEAFGKQKKDKAFNVKPASIYT